MLKCAIGRKDKLFIAVVLILSFIVTTHFPAFALAADDSNVAELRKRAEKEGASDDGSLLVTTQTIFDSIVNRPVCRQRFVACLSIPHAGSS